MSDAEVRARYLARLELEAEPPSADALARLHRAHVERVPWETLWIQSGERWGTEPVASATRIADTGRGGYCFHLNGAFSWLLTALGYDVTRHVGGVHGPDGPSAAELGNHLVLTVHGLPTAAHPDGVWYTDVGLGDALHEPIPLRAGEHASGPFTFGLGTCGAPGLDWHLTHRPQGAFAGMAWSAAPAEMSAFDADHRRLTTDPDSNFVRFLVLSRRDASGADLLRGQYYERAGAGATRRAIASEAELYDLLGDVYGVEVAAIPAEVRRRVWTRTEAAHQEFLASRAADED